MKKRDSPGLGIVFDARGRILGRVVSRSPLLQRELEWVRGFLLEIQKTELEKTMATKTETSKDTCNLCWLAGTIKTLKIRDDGGAFMLLDTGSDKTKYVPCTIHDDRDLARLLGRFRVEDQIKLNGFVRAWSQKKNETWENKVEIRITGIKTEPPKRESVASDGGDDQPW